MRFREYLYEQCHEVTVQHVSKTHEIPYTTVERIYYSIAQIKLQEQQTKLRIQAALQEEVTVIGIDEIAVRKGHIYETVLVDLLHGGTLGMAHERNFNSALQLLQAHSVLSMATLEAIVVDMWEPFHKAIREVYPNIKIIIDKYHVVQKVTKHLNLIPFWKTALNLPMLTI